MILLAGLLLLVLSGPANAASPEPAVRPVEVDEYAEILAGTNLSLYVVVRHAYAEADGESERLKTTASALGSLIAAFRARLQVLRSVIPSAEAARPSHRAVLKRFAALETWTRELADAFTGGEPQRVAVALESGRSALGDLRASSRALIGEMERAALPK